MRTHKITEVVEEFLGENGDRLVLTRAVEGEPYREGFSFALHDSSKREYEPAYRVDLLEHEADRLLQAMAKIRGMKLS